MISLRSENKFLKKHINESQLKNVNMEANETIEQFFNNNNNTNKINQIFQSLENSLNNYYYSYSIKYF
jgi:hypothetical protein